MDKHPSAPDALPPSSLPHHELTETAHDEQAVFDAVGRLTARMEDAIAPPQRFTLLRKAIGYAQGDTTGHTPTITPIEIQPELGNVELSIMRFPKADATGESILVRKDYHHVRREGGLGYSLLDAETGQYIDLEEAATPEQVNLASEILGLRPSRIPPDDPIRLAATRNQQQVTLEPQHVARLRALREFGGPILEGVHFNLRAASVQELMGFLNMGSGAAAQYRYMQAVDTIEITSEAAPLTLPIDKHFLANACGLNPEALRTLTNNVTSIEYGKSRYPALDPGHEAHVLIKKALAQQQAGSDTAIPDFIDKLNMPLIDLLQGVYTSSDTHNFLREVEDSNGRIRPDLELHEPKPLSLQGITHTFPKLTGKLMATFRPFLDNPQAELSEIVTNFPRFRRAHFVQLKQPNAAFDNGVVLQLEDWFTIYKAAEAINDDLGQANDPAVIASLEAYQHLGYSADRLRAAIVNNSSCQDLNTVIDSVTL